MSLVTLATTPQARLSLGWFDSKNGTIGGVCGYNNQVYDQNLNPGGMDGNGVGINWVNMAADMVSLALTAEQQAQMVASYLVSSNGWVAETHALARLSATQFTVTSPGNNLTTLYKTNRALSVIQTASGYGYVATSSYDGVSVTTVTVANLSLDTGFSQVSLGQDPANAPYTSALTGATATTPGTAGPVPGASAGQENSHFCGDGTYHDPTVDNQIWS
jgi:hypothetical protein